MDEDELAVWQRRRQASFGLISQEAARGASDSPGFASRRTTKKAFRRPVFVVVSFSIRDAFRVR
jgi:hypothetical protein